MWLVLLNLKANPRGSQRQIAEAIGVTEATLTHHLNAMDSDGLITRRRDPANRRVHLLELTESGEATFARGCAPQRSSSTVASAAASPTRRSNSSRTCSTGWPRNVGTELDHGLPGPGLLQTGQ